MNASAYPETSPFGDFAGPPPVLIAASSPEAQARATLTADAAGFRTSAVTIEESVSRLDRQVLASALWVEVDRDVGGPLDRLLERVQAEAGRGSFPAIVSAPAALIDPVVARIHDPEVQLLFDATEVDRTVALAIATAWTRAKNDGRANDVSREPSADRLRQLSDEVSRIAATLARLSVAPGTAVAERPEKADQGGEAPAVSIDTVRQVIRARRLRARFFDEELFADPAWDMLLDLLQAEIAQHRVPVSSLCIAAAVPATTALRWIKTMTDAGLFKRRADPHDGRRVFVELSASASETMRRYFAEVGKVAMV
jgi:DNA-binding MarR family transcriptional regulator